MLVCPACGQENPEGFRVCGMCGAHLAEGAPERRKLATLLFCDMSGSTAMGERVDAESVREMMFFYFHEMRAAIERHGGTVEKFVGDAVMAVFGVPVAHEDDALRACRAAREMQERLAGLNEELERRFGTRIALRIGVNTGEVVAGDASSRETMVTGDAVNVAARLEQAAEPGEVLLGELTHRLVRDAVAVDPVQPLALKGKSEPLPAYRLLAVAEGAPGLARRLDAPLVGRERELELLREAFVRAGENRGCELVTVVAPAGTGKSRLAHELVTSLAGEASVFPGRCLPYGEGITFWPIAETVRHAARIGETDSPEEARAKIVALLDEHEDAAVVGERIAAAVGLAEGGGFVQEMFWAFRKLVEAQARDRTVVLVFDDIHWGEPAFLDLLEYLAGWTRDAPVLLLCLARPDLLEARPGWTNPKPNSTTLTLEPLSGDESELLIDQLLGEASVDAETRARIGAAAEGNPLFLEEYLRMLVDDGLLRRENGRWFATSERPALSIPSSIEALIASRLDLLASEERRVLERASVVGQIFYWGAVTELSPPGEQAGVGGHLQALVRKELIRPELDTFAGEDAFRFHHILVRDAAYGGIPKAQRAELHQRFADWLEHSAGDRMGEYEEILGYHLEQAQRFRAEMGPVDDHGRELARRAAERLAASGGRALARGDMAAATNLLERAISLLSPNAPERIELLLELAEALQPLGDIAAAASRLAEAAALVDASGDARLEWRARVARAWLEIAVNPERRSAEELRRIGEEAVAVFEELGDDGGLAQAWRLRMFTSGLLGQFAAHEAAAERAAEVALRAGDAYQAGENLSWVSIALYIGPTPARDGLRRCGELLARTQAMGALASQAQVLLNLGCFLAMQGRFKEARSHALQGLSLYEELGLRVFVGGGLIYVADVSLLAGNARAAEAELRRGCRLLDEVGWEFSTTAGQLARVLAIQGRYEEAETYARIAREKAAPYDLLSGVLWRSVQANVLAQQGEAEEAERLAGEAVDLARTSDSLNVLADALCDLAEVMRVTGHVRDCRSALEEAVRVYEQKGNIAAAGKARDALAALA